MPWNRSLLKIKRNAFFKHLALSSAVFAPLLLVVLVRWFPPPLFLTDGGWQGLRLVFVIDVLLGPTLTFLVYNPGKTRLALSIDFGFIGVVQLAALSYGINEMTHARIEAVAFDKGAFHAVPHSAFSTQNIEPGSWTRLGETPPRWVFVREPTAEEALGVFAFAFTERQDRFELQFLYEPLSKHRQDVLKAALSDSALDALGGNLKSRLDRLASKAGKPLYPIELDGYYRTAVLVFDDNLNRVDTLYPPTKP